MHACRPSDPAKSLHKAVSSGNIKVVSSLVEANADVNQLDFEKRTPLHVACSMGFPEHVDYLIKKGAVINLKDCWGNSPLYYAYLGGHLGVVMHLNDVGIFLDDDNSRELQYKLCRLCAEGNVELLSNLLVCGVSASSNDYGGRSALQLASINGHLEVVQLLLLHGADVKHLDRRGRNALDDAQFCKNRDIFNVLSGFEKPTAKSGSVTLDQMHISG